MYSFFDILSDDETVDRFKLFGIKFLKSLEGHGDKSMFDLMVSKIMAKR